MKIAIIGTGNLGSSIAKGLFNNKSFTSLYLSDKNTAAVNSFNSEAYVTVANDNLLAVENSEMVIFALQPKHIDKVLESVASKITKKHIIISAAASLLIESGKHPEQEIDRVTTPSGCTIEGLNAMEHQGLSSALIQGIVASFEKINQIKKN